MLKFEIKKNFFLMFILERETEGRVSGSQCLIQRRLRAVSTEPNMELELVNYEMVT